MALKTVNIGDVEIFEAGTYNGAELNEKHIDEMIKNFKEGVIESYITINHSDKASGQFKDALKALSLGFVSELKRNGKKLIADFKQVPETLAKLIEAGALKKKSIEFFKKYEHANGELFNNVLQGVTFHGADGSPAVTTLSDFIKLYKNDLVTTNIINNDENKITTLKFKKDKSMDKVEISKEEYNGLISLKADAEKNVNILETLKADNESLTSKLADSEKEVITFKKDSDDLKKLKKDIEETFVTNLKTEADEYITEQINLKKVMPAAKELYVTNYISANESGKETLELFKSDIEERAELLKTTSVTPGNKEKDSVTGKTFDELVELKTKEGKTFDEAREFAMAEIAKEDS